MGESIIEAVAIEKSYPQADGTRIQVVGQTDLSISREKSLPCSDPPAAASPLCCAFSRASRNHPQEASSGMASH